MTFVNPRQRGRRLLTENGEGSTEAILPGGVLTAWADEETVVVAGEHQTVLVRQGQQDFAPVPGVPAGYCSSVWAFGADDLWLGSLQGVVHYDGQSWSVVHELEVQATVRFWSDGSDLFFASEREFGRVRRDADNAVEVLLSLPAEIALTGMWGRASDEVFVSLIDRRFNEYRCGDNMLLWFDGAEFHRF